MDFKERFKGKTSTISKIGIDSLISSTKTPINRELPQSNPISPLLPNSSSTSLFLEQTPKYKPSSLISLQSTANKKSDSFHVPVAFERPTPKASTQNSGNQIYSFQSQPSPMLKPSFPSNGRTEEQPSPIIFREHYSSSIEPVARMKKQQQQNVAGVGAYYLKPGELSNNSTPVGFSNKQSQSLLKERTTANHKKSFNDISGTNADLMQLHKKNFEQLTHQNKQRQLTETGKELVRKQFSHQYFNSPLREEDLNHLHTQPVERNISYSPVRTKKPSSLFTFDEEEVKRENKCPPIDRGNSLYRNRISQNQGHEYLRYQNSEVKPIYDFRGRAAQNIRPPENVTTTDSTIIMRRQFSENGSIGHLHMSNNNSGVMGRPIDNSPTRPVKLTFKSVLPRD